MTIRQAILKEKKKKTSADEKEDKKCENEKVKEDNSREELSVCE